MHERIILFRKFLCKALLPNTKQALVGVYRKTATEILAWRVLIDAFPRS